MHPTNMCFDAGVDGAQTIAIMVSGSSQVFIGKALAKQLKLQTTPLRLQVHTANGKPTTALPVAGRLSASMEGIVCLLHDASGHSNVLKAGKAEKLKNARKRRTARIAN